MSTTPSEPACRCEHMRKPRRWQGATPTREPPIGPRTSTPRSTSWRITRDNMVLAVLALPWLAASPSSLGPVFWGSHRVVARLDRLQPSNEFLRTPPTLRCPALQSALYPALTFAKVSNLVLTNPTYPRMRVARGRYVNRFVNTSPAQWAQSCANYAH